MNPFEHLSTLIHKVWQGPWGGGLWWACAALICLPFVVSVIDKALNPKAALDEMAAGGFPPSRALLGVVLLVQGGGSLLVLTHCAPALGALLLAGFVFVATFAYHQFWRVRGTERIAKLNHFAENMAVVGALVLLALTA